MPKTRRIAFWMLAALAVAGPASACSFTIPIDVFEPAPQREKRVDIFHLPEIPPVAVDIGAFRRASSATACGGDATVDLILRWTAPTDFRWQDVGVYVRPVGATSTGQVPERPRIVDGVPHLTVYVPDPDPTAAMDQEYEIRVVDGWLRLGPVARFSIRSKARPSEPYEAVLKTRALVLDDDALRPQSASTLDPGVWFTPPLRARLKAGELDTRRCGLYSPYGCGAVELALLAHGDAMVGAAGGERAAVPAACIGVRQSPGRTLRMIFTGQEEWDRRIAAAEWVDDADAGDWSRVAAGCSALIASVGRQETELFEAEKAKRESWKRRRTPCGQTQGTGGCK